MNSKVYTLRNVQIHDHIVAQSDNLTEIMAIKLYNQVKWSLETAIFDQDDYLVDGEFIKRYMYHLELNRRVDYDNAYQNAQSNLAAMESAMRLEIASAASAASNGDVAKLEILDLGKKIEDCIVLAHGASILVPSTYNGNEIADPKLINEVVNLVANSFAAKFGGSNVEVERQGRWIASNGEVVIEGCTPVNVRFDAIDNEVVSWIVNLAANVQRAMVQESVYFEVDGIAHLLF